jgi:hypothetical protein
MDWKFIMCLLVMCSTTIWKLLEILTYGEIQVRQVDDIMMMYARYIIALFNFCIDIAYHHLLLFNLPIPHINATKKAAIPPPHE